MRQIIVYVDVWRRSLTDWGNMLPSSLVVRWQPHLNIATVTHASWPVKVNLLYYPCWHCVGTGATVNFPWKSLWKFASLGPSKISKPRRNKSSPTAAVWTKAWKRCNIHSQQANPISDESNDSGTKGGSASLLFQKFVSICLFLCMNVFLSLYVYFFYIPFCF